MRALTGEACNQIDKATRTRAMILTRCAGTLVTWRAHRHLFPDEEPGRWTGVRVAFAAGDSPAMCFGGERA